MSNDKNLHILILENRSADAHLAEHELRKAGLAFDSRCVETEAAFVCAIKEFAPDLILSDYAMPQYDGLSALAMAQRKCPEVPFILSSGSIGEEGAIEALKLGATDYVLKEH